MPNLLISRTMPKLNQPTTKHIQTLKTNNFTRQSMSNNILSLMPINSNTQIINLTLQDTNLLYQTSTLIILPRHQPSKHRHAPITLDQKLVTMPDNSQRL